MAMQRTAALAELLSHFEHQAVAAVGVRRKLVRISGRWPSNLHVDDGADDLGDCVRSLYRQW